MHSLSLAGLVITFLLQCSVKSQQEQLQLNQVLTLSDISSSTSLSIPTSNPVAISLSICSSSDNISPSISLKNGTDGRTTNLAVNGGLATFNGFVSKDSVLQIDVGGGEMDVDITVSSNTSSQSLAATLPQVGDTTATQAIFFSPVFAASNHVSPEFPNYTLPLGELDAPNPPSNTPNFTLLLIPTNKIPANFRLQNSLCAIQNLANDTDGGVIIPSSSSQVNGLNVTTNPVLKGIKEGWRFQWLIEGLKPATNYTIWTIQDDKTLGGPINALTKSSSFSCTLAHSIPYCPSTAWAIPLPAPPDGTTTYTSSNLPSAVSAPLISSITNFTIALLTLACGRDLYSPIQTCEDCAFAYRSWACAVSLPRCADPASIAAADTSPVQPALINHPSEPARTNLTLDNPNSTTTEINTYTELLPCIESCTLVDRACPPLFGWQCPILGVTANTSYGVGFIDALDGTGDGFGNGGVREGGGVALVEAGNSAVYRYGTDRFGTAWCNGNG